MKKAVILLAVVALVSLPVCVVYWYYPYSQLASIGGSVYSFGRYGKAVYFNGNVEGCIDGAKLIYGDEYEFIENPRVLVNEKLRWLWTIDGVFLVNLSNTDLTDDGMRLVSQVGTITDLRLRDTNISDAALIHVAKLAHLTSLSLNNTDITDEGIKELAGLRSLESLDLSGTGITDASLQHLSRLERLHSLWLDGTDIDGSGLIHLTRLPDLNRLFLRNTGLAVDSVVPLYVMFGDTNVRLIEIE